MKRIFVCITFILLISLSLSIFVKAKEKNIDDLKPIKSVEIDTKMLNDNAMTKLNFFKKNINVIVIYK